MVTRLDGLPEPFRSPQFRLDVETRRISCTVSDRLVSLLVRRVATVVCVSVSSEGEVHTLLVLLTGTKKDARSGHISYRQKIDGGRVPTSTSFFFVFCLKDGRSLHLIFSLTFVPTCFVCCSVAKGNNCHTQCLVVTPSRGRVGLDSEEDVKSWSGRVCFRTRSVTWSSRLYLLRVTIKC